MVRLLNFLLYQLGWFACVFGVVLLRPWWGIAVAMLFVGIHLYLTTDRSRQVKILLVSLGVGLVVDSLLLSVGVYSFPGGSTVAWLPPVWMSVLWIQFATTFRYCLKWLSGRYMVGGLFGFMGAPLAFLGGEKLGAVEFLPPRYVNLLTLGIVWAVAIPLLIYVSDRIHRSSQSEASYRGFRT